MTPDLVSPGVLQLRLLARNLDAQLGRMDARVDELLLVNRATTDAEVSEVDVLCASIAEVRELLDEVRTEAARETMARRARRSQPKRWV